jgi:hypothetical protein
MFSAGDESPFLHLRPIASLVLNKKKSYSAVDTVGDMALLHRVAMENTISNPWRRAEDSV